MLETESYEGPNWEVDADYFGDVFPRGCGEPACEGDEPITSHCTNEDCATRLAESSFIGDHKIVGFLRRRGWKLEFQQCEMDH